MCHRGRVMTAVDPTPTPAATGAERIFSTSVVISAIRCSLSYVILPWLAPLLGWQGALGPVVGILLGAVAIAANLWSIRRFWSSGHRLRRPISALNAAVIVLVVVLVVRDIGRL